MRTSPTEPSPPGGAEQEDQNQEHQEHRVPLQQLYQSLTWFTKPHAEEGNVMKPADPVRSGPARVQVQLSHQESSEASDWSAEAVGTKQVTLHFTGQFILF